VTEAAAPGEARAAMPWDAAAYERAGEAQFRWALEVLEWRAWRGDERVLDAGCGPGRVSESLLGRVPRGHVTAVDRDADMVAKATARLAPYGERARVVQADLERLPEGLGPVDVVVSTAVLHWVPDLAAAFRGFRRVLRPGGDLLAQWGGAGNIADLEGVLDRLVASPPFAPRFEGWRPPWHFATPAEAAGLLRGAGFESVDVALERKPTPFPDRASFLAFCAAAPLRPHLGRMPPEQGAAFVAALGDVWQGEGRAWALDYVRLNARAKRSKTDPNNP